MIGKVHRLVVIGTIVLVVARSAAAQGEPAPLQPNDLLREADKASPAVASILRELAVPDMTGDYARQVLERVDLLLKTADPLEGAWAAEKALRATLRFAQSQRQVDDTSAAATVQLSEKLPDVRRRLLQLLSKRADLGEALHWADIWLPLHTPESPVGDAVRALWVQNAQQILKAGQPAAARRVIERIDRTFADSPQAEPLRATLRERAASLLKQARDVGDAQAVPLLEQAVTVWPRLPGLRDELEKRQQAYQVLYVAVRELPEYLSPALAWTDSERQAVELIFEGLVQGRYEDKVGLQYRPSLAEHVGTGGGLRRPVALRRDVYWSDGERFTAGDVRHTVQLLTRSGQTPAALWRDLLEPPRLESDPFRLEVVQRQGLLQPWAPLRIKMLPQHAHGKPLSRADDVEFARQPVGTGPFQFQVRSGIDGTVYVVLQANPQFVRRGQTVPGGLREIRFVAWPDADAELSKPAPHLALDLHPAQAAALKRQGYADLRPLQVPRVWFLGFNHRRAPFANLNVRLALAHAIDRQGLLDRHFHTELAGATALAVTGPFPHGSWAAAPASRVPEDLYRPDEARGHARKWAKDYPRPEWTLKYPAGDRRLDTAFKELSEQVAKVLAGAGVQVTIRPLPLSPRQLQTAVREHDFDLVYHRLDAGDAPDVLWALFDPHADALAAGGSNFLGVEQDAKLQEALRAAMHHRHFAEVRDFMHSVHDRLYRTMPLVPLWQLPYIVAVHGKLRAPDLDPLAVLGDIANWKLSP
jgi:peptide/nickel transport system substrate-binding protein